MLIIGSSRWQYLEWVSVLLLTLFFTGVCQAENSVALSTTAAFGETGFIFLSLGIVLAGMILVIGVVWVARGRPRQLAIRDTLLLISLVFAGLITSNFALVMLLMEGEQKQASIERNKYASLNLAFELKQSSDDLTRLARTFVITGDPAFETAYWAIVAIRDGKRPHPKLVTPAYWDHVAAGAIAVDEDGETYSIEQKMEELGFSEREKAKIAEAKGESDDLINLEDIAMNAVKGRFRDAAGDFGIEGAPDPEMARDLLHGLEYHLAKSRIMKPIDEFFDLLEQRTSNDLNSVRSENQSIIWAVAILTAITIGFSIYIFFLLKRRIIKPLSVLEDGAQTLMEGDYSHQIDIESRDEIGSLAATFNALARNIDERTSRLRSVIQTAPDGVITMDSEGVIESFSSAAESIFGYSAEEIIDRSATMSELMARDYDGLLQNRVRSGEARVAQTHREVVGLRKDGAEFAMELALGEAILGDERIFTAIVRDITERKEHEEALRKARDEAEAGARAKTTFLATMSHELRTPMNGVVGMIDILSQTDMEGDQKDMLATMRSSAFSLLGIIDDVLDFSKMEAGKLEIEHIPVSIRDIVGDVAETLTAKATEKGLDLISFVDPEIPTSLLGDQVRLRQIFFNLAGNALKFTEKGRVIVRADRVDVIAADKVTVRYSVIDQGIGLSEEGLKKLFQPFSQAESSTTRRFGGTGLGLSICKTLVEAMGGKIEVESELGAGSTFTVTIPHEMVDAEEEAEIETDLKDVNVLILMRDPHRREFVRRYLEHWQATVQTTEDVGTVAETARAAAASGTPFNVIVQGLAWGEPERAALRQALQDDPQLSGIRFVVLRRDRSRRDRAEIVDAITVEGTPLRRESVLSAVAVASGRASPEVRYEEEIADLSRGEAPTVEVAELKGELILVAEDNLTNQKVIQRQLGVLGYAADVVADGQQAQQALQKKNYAILLTDCDMPVVDGFQLTQAVRAGEDSSGERLPIVAITASVMKGDVDRCLDAGMDDCLAKPLEMTKLKQMLAKWMPATTDASADIASSPLIDNPQRSTVNDKDQAPVDLTFLRECFGDDDATHREILKDFVDSTPSYLEDIQTALDQKSAGEVASLAHAFKSAARTVGAHELADLCQSLEHAGKAEQWDKIKTLAPRLDPAMESVTHFVATF